MGEAYQHIYFAWRARFWCRRRHGARPAAHYLVVGLPTWVVDDAELYEPVKRLAEAPATMPEGPEGGKR